MSQSEPASGDPVREVPRDTGRLLESLAPLYALRVARQYPAINIYDASDRFILTAELPGLTVGDFELSMTGDAITLRGARHRAPEIRDEDYRRQERQYGTWSRTISLPGKIDADRVSATLVRGVLTIVVYKDEQRLPRPIAVKMVGT